MNGSCFTDCRLLANIFMNTQLSRAAFTRTDLEKTLFHHCDLSYADFSTALNYGINPQSNKITKTKFSLPEAVSLLQALDIIIT